MKEPEYKINRQFKIRQAHRCDVCRTYFSKSFSFMSNHVRQHRLPSEPFNCEKSILNRYCCRFCQFEVETIVLLNEHMREHVVGRREETLPVYKLKCYICYYCSFESYSYLHWFKHAASGCPFVSLRGTSVVSEGSEFVSEFVVTKNKVKQVGNMITENSEKISQSPSDLKRYRCISNFSSHVDDKNNIWFTCEQCAYKTTKKYNLKEHFNAQHADDQNKKWFKCEQCAYKTTHKSNLTPHFNTQHIDNAKKIYFKCDKCAYKATQQSDVKRHFYRHVADEDKIWFKCDQCAYKSTHKYLLTRHLVRRHSSYGECFKCDKCEYKSTQKYLLKSHWLRRHSSDGKREEN